MLDRTPSDRVDNGVGPAADPPPPHPAAPRVLPSPSPLPGLGVRLAVSAAVRHRGLALAWAAALVATLAVAAAVAAPWLDPRFNYLVDDGRNHAVRAAELDAVLRRGGWTLY